jgi:hypothetical protein
MLSPIVLIPAYGHTYATKEEMRAAWDRGVDFRDWRGRTGYCSIRDLEELSYLTSSITLCDPRSRISVVVPQHDPFMPVPKRNRTALR